MGQSKIKKKLENILRQAKWKYSMSKLRGYSRSNSKRGILTIDTCIKKESNNVTLYFQALQKAKQTKLKARRKMW